jgi:hypothetical protein
VDEDDVAAEELVEVGHPLPCDQAVVDDDLQVEARQEHAGVALAARRLADVAEPGLEGEVDALDGVLEGRAVDLERARPGERRVALELRERERRADRAGERADEVGDDVGRMVELDAREVRRLARDIGDDETGRRGWFDHASAGTIPRRILGRWARGRRGGYRGRHGDRHGDPGVR